MVSALAPEDNFEFVSKSDPETLKSTPESVSEQVSKTYTFPASSVFTPESATFTMPSLRPGTIKPIPYLKLPPVKFPSLPSHPLCYLVVVLLSRHLPGQPGPVQTPPIPLFVFIGCYGSPKPAPPWSATNFLPGSVPTRPIPPFVNWSLLLVGSRPFITLDLHVSNYHAPLFSH